MTTHPDPIYLDHNATTPILPEVLEAMLPYLSTHFGNPSSSHIYGRRTREAVEHGRAQVAALIGASPEEIVFTSGGIEANNLAIRGVAQAAPSGRRIVTSVIEHPATEGPCAFLETEGWRVTRLGVDGLGRVRPSDAEAELVEGTTLLTIMHANNETGALQPVAELARLAHERGAIVHTDAAQSAGKVPVNVDDLGVDLLSIVGHKLYAPKGIGALYVFKGTPLKPLLLGSPGDVRSGTLNTPSIVGVTVQGGSPGRARQFHTVLVTTEGRQATGIERIVSKPRESTLEYAEVGGEGEESGEKATKEPFLLSPFLSPSVLLRYARQAWSP